MKRATVGTATTDTPVETVTTRLLSKILIFLSTTILLCGWAGLHASGATARPTTVPLIDANCSAPGAIRPARIVLACGDGNAVAQNLTWAKWNATSAKGTGVLRQNNCTPDCAEGTFHLFAARFVLSDPVTAGGRDYFTSIRVRFLGAEPAGRRTEMLTDCDVHPPSADLPQCP